MRMPWTWCVLAGCLLGNGCALVRDATDLMVFKSRQCWSDFSERRRNEQWAEQAWEQVGHTAAGSAFSEDYAQGFKDGFAEYLYEGGTGEPPLVAPNRYRAARYQTAVGYQAIQDWFAGYRHGTTAAHQSGYRQFVTGPSSLLPPPGP